MTLRLFSTDHVERRLGTGSSSPVVVDTAGGVFVAKLRGSGQGVPALIAEIIVAELAQRLGLPVPERVLVELLPEMRSDDRNDELADLLQNSIGLNLGFRYLDNAREPAVKDLHALDDDFATRVLWLDGLTMNPDRSCVNPNVLFWNGQPWLIDHGAALGFHHDWASVTEDSPREASIYAGHIFEARRSLLRAADEQLASLMSWDALEAAVACVPDRFFADVSSQGSAFRSRAAYHAFLWKRTKPPRPFV
jgi:hypothetical protein